MFGVIFRAHKRPITDTFDEVLYVRPIEIAGHELNGVRDAEVARFTSVVVEANHVGAHSFCLFFDFFYLFISTLCFLDATFYHLPGWPGAGVPGRPGTFTGRQLGLLVARSPVPARHPLAYWVLALALESSARSPLAGLGAPGGWCTLRSPPGSDRVRMDAFEGRFDSGTVRTVIGGIIHEIWLVFSIGSILLSTLTQAASSRHGHWTSMGTADEYGDGGRVRGRRTQKEDRTGDEGGRRLRVLET